MAAAAKLLLIERLVPPGNAPFGGASVDITMLVLTGGKERSEAEYRDLLGAAGFRLNRVVATALETHILQARPA